MTPVSVNHYLKGINPLNARFAAVLAKLLKEPIESFSPRLAAEIAEMSNVGPMVQPHRESREYPVLSWVAAGERLESVNSYPTGIAEKWLSSTENAGPHGYWLRGQRQVNDFGHTTKLSRDPDSDPPRGL